MLDAVSRELPALRQAQEISELAVAAGFEWPTYDGVLDKLREELAEFLEAREEEPGGAHELEELGDVLFTAVQLARKDNLDAEDALAFVCEKFRTRWAIMEQYAFEELDVHAMGELAPQDLERLWERAKADLRKDRT